MKLYYKLLMIVTLSVIAVFKASAQNGNQVNDLIKEGVELHNQGKYADAIDKFNAALKLEPESGYANYEIAFSLYEIKKPNEAIPYLEKADQSSSKSISVGAYALLATIYDETNQGQKAIDTYQTAIKIDPDYPQIYYNIGLTYFRLQKYAEAEASAIEAIKHAPKNASSQRLYGLVCFHQNKRGNALLAFCSFLLIEPTGTRATEAFTNMMSILKGGVLKDAKGNVTIPVSGVDDLDVGTLNTSISLTAAAAQGKNLQGINQFEYELKNIFMIAGQLAEKKTNKTFFDNFFATYLYKLAQSPAIKAFIHTSVLNSPVYRAENLQWIKDNSQRMQELSDWMAKTERGL